MPAPVHYSDYLQLDKILNAQQPETGKDRQPAHDEMLFIVTHQAYELWFKQLLYEVASVNSIMLKPALNDNSPELQTVVHRLERCVIILKLLVQQIDIMETMTPMDFLDFRDSLRPASGFQSVQFKQVEAALGLPYSRRHGQEHYLSALRPEEVDEVKKTENSKSLLQLTGLWLERMPFFEEPANWQHFAGSNGDAYWAAYKLVYKESLAEPESGNLALFDSVFREENETRQYSARACRAALFIMLYRGYPVLHLPFCLLNSLLEIDEQLSTWRYRHMHMVQRIIGARIGTGGSAGGDYLKAALDKHYIFRELAALTSFLVERRRLPALSAAMEKRLGFSQQ